jgi:hypothetical protein
MTRSLRGGVKAAVAGVVRATGEVFGAILGFLDWCPLDDFSGLNYLVFFVDPVPFGDPDEHACMVVFRSGWEE